VALEVTFENSGTRSTSYAFYNASLRAADNRLYSPTIISGPTPLLSSTTLLPGQTTRGWITFELPAGAQALTFAYTPLFGAGVVFTLP
jgi:hypothetical protein